MISAFLGRLFLGCGISGACAGDIGRTLIYSGGLGGGFRRDVRIMRVSLWW